MRGESITKNEHVVLIEETLEEDHNNSPNTDQTDVKHSSRLLFVYQSKTMMRLYRRYAPHLILLDATYKTTKYALPLYFLVVKANVNYQVI